MPKIPLGRISSVLSSSFKRRFSSSSLLRSSRRRYIIASASARILDTVSSSTRSRSKSVSGPTILSMLSVPITCSI